MVECHCSKKMRSCLITGISFHGSRVALWSVFQCVNEQIIQTLRGLVLLTVDPLVLLCSWPVRQGSTTCGSDGQPAERKISSSLCAQGKWIPPQSSRMLYKLNSYHIQFTYTRFLSPCDPDCYQRQFSYRTAQEFGMNSGSSMNSNNLYCKHCYLYTACNE